LVHVLSIGILIGTRYKAPGRNQEVQATARKKVQLKEDTLASHALAVSALRTPPSCHPTLALVSLSTGFTLTVLALVSITPPFLSTETSRLVTYQC
jgi:hypothetical protein